MSSGGYYNGPVVEWARRNLAAPVKIKLLFSSRAGQIFIYALLFSIPGAFFALGFAKSLDAGGVRGRMGQGFPWGKLCYVEHVTNYVKAGRVTLPRPSTLSEYLRGAE